MTDTTGAAGLAPHEAAQEIRHVLNTLRGVLDSSESDTARIAAAKLLLDRLPIFNKEETDARAREAEERSAAVAEARCLLAEFTATAVTGHDPSPTLVENGSSGTDHTPRSPPLATMVDHGRTGMGEDPHGCGGPNPLLPLE